jgi:hypothetical protein
MLDAIPSVAERLADHYYIGYHMYYDHKNGLKPDG